MEVFDNRQRDDLQSAPQSGPGARDWHHEFAHRALYQLAVNQTKLLRSFLEERPADLPVLLMGRVAERLGMAEAEWRRHAAGITVHRSALPVPCWIVQMPEPLEMTEAHFVGLVLREDNVHYFTLERTGDGATAFCLWDAEQGRLDFGEGTRPAIAAFEAAIEMELDPGRRAPPSPAAPSTASTATPTPARKEVSSEHVSKENLTRDHLLSILDAAMMDMTTQGDRTISVSESGVRCHVTVPEGRTDYITFAAYWDLKQDVPRELKLERVNRLNNGYLAVRAALDDASDLVLDMQILLPVEVSKKYFVLMLKRFTVIARDAVAQTCGEILR